MSDRRRLTRMAIVLCTTAMLFLANRFLSGTTASINLAFPVATQPADVSDVKEIATNVVALDLGPTGASDRGTLTAQSFAPVPEPALLALLGLGLVGFGRVARRRRVKAYEDLLASRSISP
jgi:hypothetical protein